MNINGIPCGLSPRERAALKRWCAGFPVLELGSLLGGSTIEIASVASRVTSVDPHRGYRGLSERAFRSNLDRLGASHKVGVIVEDFRNIKLPSAERAFIDLTGELELTRTALRSVDAPVVMIHDLMRQGCSGVELALSNFKIIEHVDSLAVCVKKL